MKGCVPCRRAVSEALHVQKALPYWACKGAAALAVLLMRHSVVYTATQQHLLLVSLCLLRRLAARRVFSTRFPPLDSKITTTPPLHAGSEAHTYFVIILKSAMTSLFSQQTSHPTNYSVCITGSFHPEPIQPSALH